MKQINEIIVHCSATPEGANFTVEDIDRWHRKRGFRCIGYHYVIYLEGADISEGPSRRKGLTASTEGTTNIVSGCAYRGRG